MSSVSPKADMALPHTHHNNRLVAWNVTTCMGSTRFMCVRCGSGDMIQTPAGHGFNIKCKGCGEWYHLYEYRGINYIKTAEPDDMDRIGLDCPKCGSQRGLGSRPVRPECHECGKTCSNEEALDFREQSWRYASLGIKTGRDDALISLLERASVYDRHEGAELAFGAKFNLVFTSGGFPPKRIKCRYTAGENSGLQARIRQTGADGLRLLLADALEGSVSL